MTADGIALPDLDGAVAIPRRNGEPVFDAPWQSRAFGMVVALHKRGHYPWDDFKNRLIEEVARDGGDKEPEDVAAYYDQFVAAFTRLLVETKLLDEAEVARRTDEFKTGERRDVY